MATADRPAAPRRITRTFLLCHALRWLPTGFMLPILVLVPTERGLGLPAVGLLFAVYGATTALLELPTGGLADTIGRRPVLLVATVADAGLLVALIAGTRPWHFILGALVGGIGRALLSGPLEAWYVDAVRAVDPRIPLRPGLGAAGLVEGIAIAIGAVASAVLPTIGAGLPVDGPVSQLTLPLYGGLVAEAASFTAVLVLLHEPARPRRTERTPGRVAAVVADGLRLAGTAPDLRLLCATFVLVAVALVGVEVLWQPRFAALLGGAERASRTFGYVVVAMSLGASAGSWAAGRLRTAVTARPGLPAAGTAVAAAAALAWLASADVFPVAVVAYVVLSGFEAAQQVLLGELLHERVPAERRTTMVSVQSLCMQTGNVIAGMTLTRIAAAAGIPAAWLVGAALLVVTAPLLVLVGGPEEARSEGPRTRGDPLLRSDERGPEPPVADRPTG